MKKIMFAAAAVALAGVASAANVFDYKASVKAVDLKSVKGYPVKVVKSNTLTGYLVTRPGCPCENCSEFCASTVNSFLVLRNKRTMPKFGGRSVRLLPANLLAKVWATKDVANAKKATLEAEGYLFAGDNPNADFILSEANYAFGAAGSAESEYLLGQYNTKSLAGSFYETWLYAAGFGKGYMGAGSDFCVVSWGSSCLKNLKGSVIGGSYVCEKNGFGEGFLCLGWSDDGTTDVVSGTWSIKENSKVGAGANTIELLIIAAGNKIDKKFVKTEIDPDFCGLYGIFQD